MSRTKGVLAAMSYLANIKPEQYTLEKITWAKEPFDGCCRVEFRLTERVRKYEEYDVHSGGYFYVDELIQSVELRAGAA